jgi:amidase
VDAFTGRHRAWLALDRERARIRARWADFFRDVDVLLCPVIASPAFAHLQEGTFETRTLDFEGVTRPYADLGWWPMLIGMAYLPSTVVPVGRTAEGLPIGVQVVGPYLEDRTTLAIAKALTDRLGNPAPPPMAR